MVDPLLWVGRVDCHKKVVSAQLLILVFLSRLQVNHDLHLQVEISVRTCLDENKYQSANLKPLLAAINVQYLCKVSASCFPHHIANHIEKQIIYCQVDKTA